MANDNGNGKKKSVQGDMFPDLKKMVDEAFAKFVGIAGWDKEDPSFDTAAIEKQIADLQRKLEEFPRRKELAREFMIGVAKASGGFATVEQLVLMSAQKFGVNVPKRGGALAKTAPDEHKQAVLDNLDGEGKKHPQIAKDTGLDGAAVSAALLELVKEKKILTRGERKGKEYFLPAVVPAE